MKNHVLSKSAYVGPDPFSLSGTIREFLMFGQNNFKTEMKFMMHLNGQL